MLLSITGLIIQLIVMVVFFYNYKLPQEKKIDRIYIVYCYMLFIVGIILISVGVYVRAGLIIS